MKKIFSFRKNTCVANSTRVQENNPRQGQKAMLVKRKADLTTQGHSGLRDYQSSKIRVES